jgi:ABC-type transporter Mla maintaining outer membrane lipid asymmetry ATPase subunit MlaF
MTENAVVLRNVTKTFGAHTAVDHLNLTVPTGSVYGFIGPNGSGLMILRIAVPPGIDWWQPALGLVLMPITTVAFDYAAGRIFRVGILMQGKGASVRDLARWIIQG